MLWAAALIFKIASDTPIYNSTMKKILMAAIVTMAATACCNLASAAEPADTFARSDIRDLALIYQGGSHRISWTPEEITPYVTHRFADGSEQWLFDGFLFLEFKDNQGNQYSPGYAPKNARRAEWQWYLDRLFERGRSLDALNQVIGQKKAEIGEPGFRHKVVLTVMVPIAGQKDWGELDGRQLDFCKREDQIAASRWFIDQLISRFNEAEYENLDLWGFYWIDEDMVATQDFPKAISPYIHERGLHFCWIPYYNAPGHERWSELGFDIAYHLPNYFFSKWIPRQRLDDAIDEALRCGMAMEFECDELAQSQLPDNSRQRMVDYIDAFERRGVFHGSALAYYTGHHLLLDFLKNPTPENRALADRLARLIIGRRAALH